jgi:Fe-S-cluster containining protein
MAQAKGLSPRAFKKRYVRRAKGKFSLKERENGDCTLLEGGRCTVYDAKPTRCSTFPFWPEILGDPSEWRETRKRCEGIDQGPIYDRADIERLLDGDAEPLLRHQAEFADGPADGAIPWHAVFAELEALYADLERELPRYRFTCAASGKCCDFDAYGHRLYVTTIEAEYFFLHGPGAPLNDSERLCPAYGEEDRLCHAREGRMLGCRAYFCGPYPVIPPDDVYERYHAKLKRMHERHGVPFEYCDLLEWRRRRTGV